MILYYAGGKKYVGCANPIRESPPSLDMFQNMPAKANQPIPSGASVDLRVKQCCLITAFTTNP